MSEINQGPDYIFQKKKDIRRNRRNASRRRVLFFLSILFVLFAIGLAYYYSSLSRINFINISGNERIRENEILAIIDVKEGDLRLSHSNSSIRNALVNNAYIQDAEVSKSINGTLNIVITEETPLCYFYNNDKVTIVTKSKKLIQAASSKYSWLVDIPLANGFNESDVEELVSALSLVDPAVLANCLEIRRYPLSYDTTTVYYRMNDGNYMFMASKLSDRLNYYFDILKSLKVQKACIFVDEKSNSAYTSSCPWDVVEEENTDDGDD